MQLFRKFLLLGSLLGGVGNAQAGLLQIELTGNLEDGYQSYSDTFNLGSSDVDLSGLEATFRFTIDIQATRSSFADDYYWIEQAGPAFGHAAGFITSSVTINNVTRTMTDSYFSQIVMEEDTDGAGFSSADRLYILTSEFKSFVDQDNVYHSRDSSMSLSAHNYVMSLIDGTDLNKLDGWSYPSSSPTGSEIEFAITDYFHDYNSDSEGYNILTWGWMDLHNVRIWGDGLNGNSTIFSEPSSMTFLRAGLGLSADSTPVSEPGSLTLLGVGLGLLALRRRVHRQADMLQIG